MKRTPVVLGFALTVLLVLTVFSSCERRSLTEPEESAENRVKGGEPTSIEVVKTADGFWERRTEYDWTIEKTADPTSIDICSGASGMITYTLIATRSMTSEIDVYGVRGEICVTNTGGAPTECLEILEVIWVLPEGGAGWELLTQSVDVSAKPVLDPGETYCYPYEILFTPVPGARYKNIVRVSYCNPENTVADQVSFELPAMPSPGGEEIDEEALVTETEYCPAGFICTPSDPGPWHLYDSETIVFTKTVEYDTAMCDTYYDLLNEVVLEETDTGELRADSALVEIYTCPCGGGCTLTIGYWKTHAGFHGNNPDRVTQYLPIWLGTGSGKSIHVTGAEQAMNILGQHHLGHPSNGITKLYAQLLGAKLNIANGADDRAAASTIAAADDFLEDHDWMDWESLSRAERRRVNRWKNRLDDYNNGRIGPGHCD
jgi:hypothetical protein